MDSENWNISGRPQRQRRQNDREGSKTAREPHAFQSIRMISLVHIAALSLCIMMGLAAGDGPWSPTPPEDAALRQRLAEGGRWKIDKLLVKNFKPNKADLAIFLWCESVNPGQPTHGGTSAHGIPINTAEGEWTRWLTPSASSAYAGQVRSYDWIRDRFFSGDSRHLGHGLMCIVPVGALPMADFRNLQALGHPLPATRAADPLPIDLPILPSYFPADELRLLQASFDAIAESDLRSYYESLIPEARLRFSRLPPSLALIHLRWDVFSDRNRTAIGNASRKRWLKILDDRKIPKAASEAAQKIRQDRERASNALESKAPQRSRYTASASPLIGDVPPGTTPSDAQQRVFASGYGLPDEMLDVYQSHASAAKIQDAAQKYLAATRAFQRVLAMLGKKPPNPWETELHGYARSFNTMAFNAYEKTTEDHALLAEAWRASDLVDRHLLWTMAANDQGRLPTIYRSDIGIETHPQTLLTLSRLVRSYLARPSTAAFNPVRPLAAFFDMNPNAPGDISYNPYRRTLLDESDWKIVLTTECGPNTSWANRFKDMWEAIHFNTASRSVAIDVMRDMLRERIDPPFVLDSTRQRLGELLNGYIGDPEVVGTP